MKKEEFPLTNPTKLYTMLMLMESDMHGYEIISEFKRISKKLSPGQIYPLLARMVKKGLVEFYEEFQGKRKRKVYTLTQQGREFAEESVSKLKEMFEVLE